MGDTLQVTGHETYHPSALRTFVASGRRVGRKDPYDAVAWLATELRQRTSGVEHWRHMGRRIRR